MGKLVVFEGIDGSGKSTQFKLMCSRLAEQGEDFRNLTFPQYSEPSSALIRMYLSGEFGSDPNSVNPYAASSFFAVDRYASYVKTWGEYYKSGGTIITDRYTTSNAIHQASKLPQGQRQEYFRWLYDYEFKYMQLPEPDCVIYMSTPIEVSVRRMRLREQHTHTHADIHEQDNSYLKKCFDCGLEAAEFYGWQKIDSVQDGKEKTVEQIHAEIYSIIENVL